MIETIFIEGLIYGIMVLGLFISYRTLNFCDMTVDGAFPMGGCILAACLTHGMAPVTGILFAFIGGCLAGLVTTLLYTKLRVPDLLAGILMMTMLYSINLRIMQNRANVHSLSWTQHSQSLRISLKHILKPCLQKQEFSAFCWHL